MEAESELIELDFFNRLSNVFSSNMIFYCVTGSLGRKEFIKNWSDIDVVIGLDIFTPDDLHKINTILTQIASPTKIGITLYSLSELGNMNLLDRKTINTLYNIERNTYAPRIIKREILPQVTLQKLIEINVRGVPEYIHQLKRELLLGLEKFDEKKVYKIITLLSRYMYLKRDGAWIDGVRSILEKNRTCSPDWLIRFSPGDIMENKRSPNERFANYEKFLINFIREYRKY